MRSLLRPAMVLLAALSVITGVLYPAAVTVCAQLAAPRRANGSLVYDGSRVTGSELIGQAFDDPRYFWGRPSATEPYPYNAMASSGSNLGPSNPRLREAVLARIRALRSWGGDDTTAVPVDLVTASGSGLDPHVTPAAAFYQVPRIARLRGLPEERLRALVERSIEGRTWGCLGEPRVNILRLNRELAPMKPAER